MLLGIRPEDLRIADASMTRDALHATVELVEPLGHEQLVHLRAGDRVLAARIDRDTAPAPETTVALTMDPARVHLFDEGTGVSLGG